MFVINSHRLTLTGPGKVLQLARTW